MIDMHRRPCSFHRPQMSQYTLALRGTGYLLGFGISYEELDNGAGHYNVAIIELEDGTLIELCPQYVKVGPKK